MSTCSSSSEHKRRRSSRVRAQPARLAEEQEHYESIQEEEKAWTAATSLLELGEESESDSNTDEEEPTYDSENEEEGKDEAESNTAHDETTWSSSLTDFTPPSNLLSTPSYLTESEPLPLFQLFLSPRLMQQIAASSTAYAHFKGASTWSVDAAELYRLVAVHIIMGVHRLPRSSMYWQAEWGSRSVATAMSRNRYRELIRYFYISDPTTAYVSTSPVSKLSSLINHLQASFQLYSIPSRNLTIDESIVPFKGRSRLKQYIPSKPHKYGYKVWCLASSGYVHKFEVYEGKEERKSEEGALHDLVIRLIQPFRFKHHILYLDSHFTSPRLFDSLNAVGVLACGTVRPKRREFPRSLITAASSLTRGNSIHQQRGQLVATAYQDRKTVYFLSTYHPANRFTAVKRVGKDGVETSVNLPTVVYDYNQGRCGVDLVDQMQGYYSLGRRSRKWWPRLAWWLIDICIINAYSLYTRQQQVKISQLQFRMELVKAIAAEFPSDRDEREQWEWRVSRHGRTAHYPEHSQSRRNCVYCSGSGGERTKANYRCDHCRVFLCVDNCFRLYHERD